MISGFAEWIYLVRECDTYGSVSFVFVAFCFVFLLLWQPYECTSLRWIGRKGDVEQGIGIIVDQGDYKVVIVGSCSGTSWAHGGCMSDVNAIGVSGESNRDDGG